MEKNPRLILGSKLVVFGQNSPKIIFAKHDFAMFCKLYWKICDVWSSTNDFKNFPNTCRCDLTPWLSYYHHYWWFIKEKLKIYPKWKNDRKWHKLLKNITYSWGSDVFLLDLLVKSEFLVQDARQEATYWEKIE